MKLYISIVDDETNLPVMVSTVHTDVVDANGDILTTKAVMDMLRKLESSEHQTIEFKHGGVAE